MSKRKLMIILIPLIVLSFFSVFYFAMAEKKESEKERTFKDVTIRAAFSKFPEVIAFVKYASEKADEIGVKLDVSWYGFDEIVDKIILDYRAGIKSWDLFYVDAKELPTYVRIGAVTPIEEFISDPSIADSNLDLDDFDSTLIEVNTSDGFWGPKGILWAFPNYSGPNALIFRSDLFNHPQEKTNFKRKYGYDLVVPKTYNQFYDAAEFFTRTRGEILAGEVLESDFYGNAQSCKPGGFIFHDYLNFALGFGAQNIYYADTLMPAWNEPENIAAGKYFVSLKSFMPPGASAMSSGESLALFVEGRVLMTIEYTLKVGTACNDPERSKIIGKWDYTINPTVPESGRIGAGLYASNFAAIYSLSRNKEIAYKLCEYVASKEVQKRRAIEDNLPPVRISVMNDPEVMSKQPWMKNFSKITAPNLALEPDVMNPHFNEILDITSTAISQAFAGEISVEEAYNIAQKQLIDLFKDAGYIK